MDRHHPAMVVVVNIARVVKERGHSRDVAVVRTAVQVMLRYGLHIWVQIFLIQGALALGAT